MSIYSPNEHIPEKLRNKGGLGVEQALAAVGGTAIMFWQEILMRKAFLAEDATARLVLEGLPAHHVSNFPYGHPQGVVLLLSVFISSNIGSVLFWEAFVFHTLSAAG